MSLRPLRILLVSHRYPWPVTRGDTLTVYNMARYFGARHELDLLCHAPTDEAVEDVSPLVRRLACVPFSKIKAAGRLVRAVPGGLPMQVAWCGSGALRRAARRLHAQRHYDVVMSYYVRPAEAVRDLPVSSGLPAKVVAMQLSLALQFARGAEHAPTVIHRLLRRWEARRLARYERRMFEAFDKVLLISKRDRDHIPGAVEKKIHYNPHGVDTDKFAPRPDAHTADPGNHAIVFTGLMQFHPNADAACYFVRHILPLVRRRVPDATFTIVGKNPTAQVRALAADPSVTVTGTVPNVADYLARAAVAVDPLRIGAGLQNKVLEALSMGVPMVATTIANEGIGAHDGEHLLIRDDPQAFADAVADLLLDPRRRRALGTASRQWIGRHWTWEVHFERLDAMLCELVASRRASLDAREARRRTGEPVAADGTSP